MNENPEFSNRFEEKKTIHNQLFTFSAVFIEKDIKVNCTPE